MKRFFGTKGILKLMAQRRKNLLLFGHYGVPNWGDEAILSGMLKVINQAKWNVTVVSPFSEFIRKNYHIPAVPPPPAGLRSFWHTYTRRKENTTKKALQEADYIIFGGGGLFQEEPKRALRIWQRYLKICLKMGKKVFLVGNSLGPFRSSYSLRQTAKLLSKTFFCSVRDQESEMILQKMNIPEQKIWLATDASFLLPSIATPFSRRKGILIALRHGDFSKLELQAIREFCRKVEQMGEKVEFFPMQSPQSHDEKVGKELELSIFLPKNLSEVRKKISQARCVLAGRLHAGILAMLSGTPFIAFPTRPKISNFLTSCGLQDSLLPKNWNSQQILKMYTTLLKNPQKTQNLLKKTVQSEKKKTANLFPGFL